MADGEQEGGFIQFPLCVIARTEPDFRKIMDQAISYGILEFIIKTEGISGTDFASYSNETKESFLDVAREKIGFRGGNGRDIHATWKEVNRYLHNWSGAASGVRLSRPLAFAIRDGELSEIEGRILMGIYSMIGAKPYAKIGWPMIQARAAGLLKPVKDWAFVPQHGPIYSRDQIERAIPRLENRSWFARVSYKKGERYWSHRLDRDALWKRVADLKLKRAAKNADRQMEDHQRSQQIREKLARLHRGDLGNAQ